MDWGRAALQFVDHGRYVGVKGSVRCIELRVHPPPASLTLKRRDTTQI